MNAPQPSHSPRYEFLDALRGLAILGVVCTHAAWFATGGSPHPDATFRGEPFAMAGMYGVQLFFLVSAFTIFMTLERALTKERVPVRSFYVRRVLRILPMFWVGIVLYAFLPGREHYYAHFNLTASYYIVTALFQHTWHPYYINSVVPGCWTIGVEMTFYMVTPLIFFRVRTWQRAVYFLLATLFLAEAANYSLRHLTDHHGLFQPVLADQPELMQQYYFKWFPSQLPVFACGILTYCIVKSLPDSFRIKRNGLVILAASAVLLYNAVDIGSHRVLPEQVVFGFGFLLLILALAIYPQRLLVNPVTGFLGRISYSFYLMHFLVMEGEIRLFQTYLPHLYDKPALAFVALLAGTLMLATPVAWTTYTIVEQPFIRLGAAIVRRLNATAPIATKPAVALTPSDT